MRSIHKAKRSFYNKTELDLSQFDITMIILLQGFATVTVTVTDINDNTPLFGAVSYRGTVRENAPSATTVELVGIHNCIGSNNAHNYCMLLEVITLDLSSIYIYYWNIACVRLITNYRGSLLKLPYPPYGIMRLICNHIHCSSHGYTLLLCSLHPHRHPYRLRLTSTPPPSSSVSKAAV